MVIKAGAAGKIGESVMRELLKAMKVRSERKKCHEHEEASQGHERLK